MLENERSEIERKIQQQKREENKQNSVQIEKTKRVEKKDVVAPSQSLSVSGATGRSDWDRDGGREKRNRWD
jgi:hypothetical protein